MRMSIVTMPPCQLDGCEADPLVHCAFLLISSLAWRCLAYFVNVMSSLPVVENSVLLYL